MTLDIVQHLHKLFRLEIARSRVSYKGASQFIVFQGHLFKTYFPGNPLQPHGIKQLLHLGGNRSEPVRSEEHTSELQSLMRISYAVFCLKKKTNRNRMQ